MSDMRLYICTGLSMGMPEENKGHTGALLVPRSHRLSSVILSSHCRLTNSVHTSPLERLGV